MSDKMISIVIPTHSENDDTYLVKIAEYYPAHPAIEYIVVDIGTPQNVFDRMNRSDFSILKTQSTNRAARLNLGFEKSKGAIVFFHHPRSLIDLNALTYLIENQADITWGGLTHKFDESNLGLKWTSWYSNLIRPNLWKILYLDHCVFFRREFLTHKIPDIPIFEDTELSYILSKQGPPQILPHLSTTSAIRFKKNGFLKQAWLNQKMKIYFHIGRSKEKMNREYEKNLNLNS